MAQVRRIRIHHYWSRDLEYLYKDKYERNKRWYGETRALAKVRFDSEINEFFDPLILHVIHRLSRDQF